MKQNKYKHPKYDKEADELFMNKHIQRFDFSLFHWTSRSHTYKILHSRGFRMKNAYCFSDKDEFVKGIYFLINLITECREKNVKFELLLGIKKELERILRDKTEIIPYVVCFTANKHNTYLKINYGDRGSGGLFKIQPKRLAKKSKLTFVQVIYDHDVFRQRGIELLWSYADILDDYIRFKGKEIKDAFRNLVPLLMRDLFILAISYKDQRFKEEEEFRFINFCLNGSIEYKNQEFLIFPRRYYHLEKIT